MDVSGESVDESSSHRAAWSRPEDECSRGGWRDSMGQTQIGFGR